MNTAAPRDCGGASTLERTAALLATICIKDTMVGELCRVSVETLGERISSSLCKHVLSAMLLSEKEDLERTGQTSTLRQNSWFLKRAVEIVCENYGKLKVSEKKETVSALLAIFELQFEGVF